MTTSRRTPADPSTGIIHGRVPGIGWLDRWHLDAVEEIVAAGAPSCPRDRWESLMCLTGHQAAALIARATPAEIRETLAVAAGASLATYRVVVAIEDRGDDPRSYPDPSWIGHPGNLVL